VPINLPEKSPPNDEDVLKRRLLGAAVFIALAVIILPLVLDGSGSESRFRRVEQLREEPPRIVDPAAEVKIPAKSDIARPAMPDADAPATSESPVSDEKQAADSQIKVKQKPEEEKNEETVSKKTPAAPVETVSSEPLEVPADEPPEAGSKPQQTEQQLPADSTSAAESPVDDVVDEVVESVAWVIQAGSFTDEINALTARDQLRDADFPAFVSQAESAGKFVFRVKVGPLSSRQQATRVQRKVESLMRQPTIIKQYR